jgi:protein associated with RNAse G/E
MPSPTQSNEIIVVVFKHDESEYRRWHGQLVEQDGSLLVVNAEFEVDVSHQLLGKIKRGARLIEYYWLGRWYNVFRFLDEDGCTRLYYCNINKPPAFDGRVLSYIDLDIDVIVKPDYSFEVQDLEEFEVNSKRYGYTTEEKKNVEEALRELTGMIQSRQFPFVSECAERTSA